MTVAPGRARKRCRWTHRAYGPRSCLSSNSAGGSHRVISVRQASERVRRSLSWQLSQALRASDLIASQGREHFRVLLTSPDAEHAERVRTRLEELVRSLHGTEPVAMDVAVEEERRRRAR